MLQVMEADHQAHGLGRGAIGVAELGAELVLEDGSVDLVGEKDQRVVRIDNDCQFDLEQIALGIGVAAGTELHLVAGFLRDLNCFTANNYSRSIPFCISYIGNCNPHSLFQCRLCIFENLAIYQDC